MGKDGWGATKQIAKRSGSALAVGAPAPAAEAAPVLSRPASTKPSREVSIDDLDGTKWTFGDIKKGTADNYFPADYGGGRLVIKLNKLTPGGDDLVRAPFPAGPYKDPATGTLMAIKQIRKGRLSALPKKAAPQKYPSGWGQREDGPEPPDVAPPLRRRLARPPRSVR